METVKVTPIGKDEMLQLQIIARQTFYETFSEKNTEEDMKIYLEDVFSVEKLRAELNDVNTEFYFAKQNGEVIGYLKINFGQSQTELKDDNTVEIERIYVLKDFHGRKIGQVLYEKAIAIAIQRKSDYIWLGVWEENARAIAFYKKNGFVEFDKHIFRLGEDEQTDIMMKLPLVVER